MNNSFSLHYSIIFFLNGWENLHYELGVERINQSEKKESYAVMLDVLTVSHMMISALFFLSFLFNFSINNLEDYNVVLVYD